MERINTVIIGGGASGLFCACSLNSEFVLIERNDRLGKKLSATGNGQGNLTNDKVGRDGFYFSLQSDESKIEKIIAEFGKEDMINFFSRRGFILSADSQGRYYPLSRQGSAITDLLRYEVGKKAKRVYMGAFVSSVVKSADGYIVDFTMDGKTEKIACKNLLIATGGKSAKNFGTDGNGYDLAKKLGHSVTAIYPSLVQLKTEQSAIKGLKGIKTKTVITVKTGDKTIAVEQGDLIFTDYGVSGDAIFRLSAHLTHRVDEKITLFVDFCPDHTENELLSAIKIKQNLAHIPFEELLCGITLNKIGRLILSTAKKPEQIVKKIKNYPIAVTGNLGFDYSQVTKGGILLSQVDENLQSKKNKGLFFAGEILDCDGACGGFNIQWAFSSSQVVAKKINNG